MSTHGKGPLTGRQVGQYQILSRLGAGGMGEVYLARDTKLDRDVALKVLPEEFVSHSDRLNRFRGEARMLAAVNHPHIGAIHGVEDASGFLALVLEFVDGPTLADRLRERALGTAEALRIALEIAEALEAAHEKGIVPSRPQTIEYQADGRWSREGTRLRDRQGPAP
jgi:serine/threonine protein kinase